MVDTEVYSWDMAVGHVHPCHRNPCGKVVYFRARAIAHHHETSRVGASSWPGTIQGTFGTIQGTFGTIQGTFGTIQGKVGTIQGTVNTIQGTFGGGLARRLQLLSVARDLLMSRDRVWWCWWCV
jgi:hypothetical protein